MRRLRLLPPLLFSCLATGCATVIHGVHQDVRVETNPPGATASVNGQTITTPGVLKLRRKEKTLEVLVEKEGYASRRVTLTRKESGLIWANMGFLPVGFYAGASIGASTSTNSFGTAFEHMGTGGVVGGVTLPLAAIGLDHATGAAYKLDPPTIVLRLEPVTPPETGAVDETRGRPPAKRDVSEPTTKTTEPLEKHK